MNFSLAVAGQVGYKYGSSVIMYRLVMACVTLLGSPYIDPLLFQCTI